jgi:hypothetical protein
MAKAKKKEETGAEELFRRLKSNPPLFIGTVLILVLVIVAFVFMPAVGDAVAGGTGNEYIFGYYGSTPITYVPGNTETYFGKNLAMLSGRYGFSPDSAYPQDREAARIVEMVWLETFYRTLTHEAILDEMKNAGYGAPAVQLDREMTKRPEFLENGKFSITRYGEADRGTLFSMRKETEAEYTERQYENVYYGLLVSSGEEKLIGDMSSPERIFRMAVFPRASYPDSEVAAYGASNPAPFVMVHLSKIVIKSNEREVRQLRDSVLEGRTNFEDVARTRSIDAVTKDQGGDMGPGMAYTIYGTIPNEDERAAVLALRSGEYSEIVTDPNGWAFYRAEANPYNADLSQADNLGRVRSYMTSQAGGVMEEWLLDRAEEFISLSGEAGFEQAAAETGRNVKQFGPISLNYGNMQIFNTIDAEDPVFGWAVPNENFWNTAFTIPLNTLSVPFTLGTDVVVLEAVEETIKTDTDKEFVVGLYERFKQQNMDETDLYTAVTGSEKTRDKFYEGFLSYRISNVIR